MSILDNHLEFPYIVEGSQSPLLSDILFFTGFDKRQTQWDHRVSLHFKKLGFDKIDSKALEALKFPRAKLDHINLRSRRELKLYPLWEWKRIDYVDFFGLIEFFSERKPSLGLLPGIEYSWLKQFSQICRNITDPGIIKKYVDTHLSINFTHFWYIYSRQYMYSPIEFIKAHTDSVDSVETFLKIRKELLKK